MSWVVILAVAAALASGGWLLARMRRGRARLAPVAGGAPASAPGEAAAADGEGAPAGAADDPGPAMLLAERAILEQLCGRAAASARPAPPGGDGDLQAAAEAAAVETLAGIRAHPRYVPRRPQLLPQLTRAINDPGASAQSIAAILAQDPALAGNLLRVANSAMYARRGGPVEHLERAVALLGTDGLRRTAMAALLQPVIADDGSLFARCATLLWRHTLQSAGFALQPAPGVARDDLHSAQLLALVCGLGAVVVVQVMRDSWGKGGAGVPGVDTMVSLLDAWSVRCARAISADWGLSERVRQAMDQLADDLPDDALGPLARRVRMGRALAAGQMLDTDGPAPGGAGQA
ncbi:MAG: HDOD domain-containing protein [Xanthomonadaceae bacterium]|nr:HDOD domain-containing protein [Xanthomonadaceae bacterium]